MKFSDFIKPNSIFVDVVVDSKKNLFKKVSSIASGNDNEKSSIIVEKLNERERLGSTGVGNGVAIPHSKVSWIQKTTVLFLKLKSTINFSSADNKEVDLVFVILAPKNCQSEHLLVLSSISSFLRDKKVVKKLRELKKPDEILNFFSGF